MVKEETMRPPCDVKTPGFDQLPYSSEESQSVIFVNKPRDDNHTIKSYKTKDVPIMDETMSQSFKSLSKPQEESDKSRASQTGEQKVVYSVEERNDHTSMGKGSNDNSVNFAVVTIDTEGGMLDNSANTSSQDNISSAEGKEPNNDNYGHDANVSSSLENHNFIYGKMDNSSHLCIPPPTNVTIGGEPNEDTIERLDPVEGSKINEADIVEDIYTGYSIAESDENSSNFALDDNDTVGSRLDKSANAYSEGNNFSPEITELDNDNSHANGSPSSQMLKSHTSRGDKIGNDFLFNTRPEGSSHCGSRPNANVTVDSGPHEDTLELQKTGVTGLENNVADDSSMLGTIGMNTTQKYSQDENNGPTISKADEEQNGLFVRQNAEVIENKYITTSSHEDDNPTTSGFIDYDAVNSKLDNCASVGSGGNLISEEDTELDNTTSEHDVGIWSSQAENNISRASKTEEQNVLSIDLDSIVIEKESAASSSQGSNINSITWTGLDDNYTVGVKLDNSANTSSQDNLSSAEAKEVESGGNYEHGMYTSSSQMLESCTSMVDKTDTSSSVNTQSKQPYPNVAVDSGPHEDTLELQKNGVTGLENNVADDSSMLGTFEMDKTNKYSHDQNNGPTISEADEEQNGLFVSQNAEVIENKYIATSSHEDDNSTTSGFINYDAVNSKLDNCASAGSRDNPIFEEDTELDKTTYEPDVGIWSSQDEINTSRASKTEEQNILSIALDSIVIEKESAASTSQGSNVNSITWTGLDDNYTVGVKLDNSANTSSQDNLSSAEAKEVESGGNCEHGMDTSSSQMLESCTSMVDKTDTSSSVNTQSKQPYPNVAVDSGPHEDTLELQKTSVTGLENNVEDNSSMLGTFEMDKTNKYSHDQNNGPTISEADEEQNGLFVSQNAEVNENKYIATSSHEDDNPTTSGFIDYDAVNSKLDNCARSRGNPIPEGDTELDNTTCERDIDMCSSQAENNISRASKTEEQNVLSTDHESIVLEKESAASTSQGSNGNSSMNWTELDDNYTVGVGLDNSANTSSQDNIKEVESGGNCERGMDTSSSQMLKSCTSMVDNTDTSSSLNTQSKQPYPNVTVDSGLHEDTLERQKLDVRGQEFHPQNKALILLTSENNNNKNENLSCESQGEMVPISLKTEEENKLAETNDKNIVYGSQDKEGPRGFKTKGEQHVLNVGPDITKTKHIDYSNHASGDDFSDADRLDNSTNEGRRANTSSPEDTELDKKNNHGRKIKIQSNQELINPISMGDKMASNCPLDTRPNKSSYFSNQSFASAIEDSKLHEHTIEEQKPVRDSESLVEDKTFTNLELPHGISSYNEPEYQVPKTNNTTNTDTLGNEVDFKASETQTLDNSPFVGNRFNCFPTSGALHMVAASVPKSSKNQNKSSKSQNTNGAKRQSHLKPETKTIRQKSPKLVRNPKSNIQDKSTRVLQPKRGEKAFNETNREKRTPIAYTPKTYTAENDAGNVTENSLKERADVTRMRQSIESIRPMGSKKRQGILAGALKWLVPLYMFQFFMLLVEGTPVPALKKWQQHWFCTQGYDLINQSLAIKSLDDIRRPGCAFMAPAVPYFNNCSTLNALVFLNNKTCLEMFTTDQQSCELEYGRDYKGKYLTSVRGELFSDETVKAKVDQYERGTSPQARSYIQSTTTPAPPSTNGTTSKPLDRPALSRIIGPLAGIPFLILVLVLCVKRCMNKPKTPSPTSNGIELQGTDKDGEDTNQDLLSNGAPEPRHQNQTADTDS